MGRALRQLAMRSISQQGLHPMAAPYERCDQMPADESGAAGNKYGMRFTSH
jgi:hypothetical protein